MFKSNKQPSGARSFSDVIAMYKSICGAMDDCVDCPMKKLSKMNCKNYMVNKPDEFVIAVEELYNAIFNTSHKVQTSPLLKTRDSGDASAK